MRDPVVAQLRKKRTLQPGQQSTHFKRAIKKSVLRSVPEHYIEKNNYFNLIDDFFAFLPHVTSRAVS